jgi:hypothetical protein
MTAEAHHAALGDTQNMLSPDAEAEPRTATDRISIPPGGTVARDMVEQIVETKVAMLLMTASKISGATSFET